MVLVDPATVDQTMFSGTNSSPDQPVKDACCNEEEIGEFIMSDDNFTMLKKECALRGYIGTYCLTPDDVTSPLCHDPFEFLIHTGPMLETQLMKDVGEKKGLVLWMSLEVEMEKLDGTETTAHFTHKKKYVYNTETIMETLVTGFGDIIKNLEDYQERGSGWMVKRVNHLDVHCAQYRPLGAACYKPLPVVLRKKNSILNIKNKDNKCFMWSVLAHRHPRHWSENANYVNYYKEYENELDFNGIEFPVKLKDIGRL